MAFTTFIPSEYIGGPYTLFNNENIFYCSYPASSVTEVVMGKPPKLGKKIDVRALNKSLI